MAGFEDFYKSFGFPQPLFYGLKSTRVPSFLFETFVAVIQDGVEDSFSWRVTCREEKSNCI